MKPRTFFDRLLFVLSILVNVLTFVGNFVEIGRVRVVPTAWLKYALPVWRPVMWILSVFGAFYLGFRIGRYRTQRGSRMRNQRIDGAADIAWTRFVRWRQTQKDGKRILADAPTQQVLDWICDSDANLGLGFSYEVCARMCSKHHIVEPTFEAFTEATNRRGAPHYPRGSGF
jgi:uncharacterized membrane protein